MCGIAGFVYSNTDRRYPGNSDNSGYHDNTSNMSNICNSGNRGSSIDENVLREMVYSLRHRGPDDTGYYVDGNIGLGQCRLGIMDPLNGRQPIMNEDGTIVVVFNGEIFNHTRLREELAIRGHILQNYSDSAILPHMYEEYGTDMFNRLNGQFAIAIWSKTNRRLILARDRMGEKPLYYCCKNEAICFGSEAKAILKSGIIKPEISAAALKQVFTFWTTLSGQSIFQGIDQLPPGCYLTFQDSHIDIVRYWKLSYSTNYCSNSVGGFRQSGRGILDEDTAYTTYLGSRHTGENGASHRYTGENGASHQYTGENGASHQYTGESGASHRHTGENGASHRYTGENGAYHRHTGENGASHRYTDESGISVEEYAAELENRLKNSIKMRMMSDVPISFYLSGGLDSSLIAAMAASMTNQRLNTFSVTFDDQNFDESRFQDLMSQYLGTEHQRVHFCRKDIPSILQDVVEHAEVPLLRSGAFPMYILARLVKGCNTKVVLSGEGSDELFGGYDIFREVKVREFCSKYPDSGFRALLYKRVNCFVKNLEKQPASTLSLFYGIKDRQLWNSSHETRWRLGAYSRQFFSQDYRNQMDDIDVLKQLEEQLPEEFMEWSPLQRAQYLEIEVFFANYLLSSQGDRVSMASSVECRFPFLDHDVIDLACRLPDKLKIKAMNEKYIIKQIARKYLPEEILSRQKFPYRAPIDISELLKDGLVREMMNECKLKQYGVFDPNSVQHFLSAISSKAVPSERECMIFMGILTTQMLYEKFTK